MNRLNTLIDNVTAAGYLDAGMPAAYVMRKTKAGADMVKALGLTKRINVHAKNVEWSAEDDAFLRTSLGWLTDAEIAQELGRSANGVHIRWFRELQLPAPSRAPDVITANRAAELLGIDVHLTARLVDEGLIPGRVMAGGRNIRLIERVRDDRLRRLLDLRKQRWGDEWWTTGQAAKYYGVCRTLIERHIVHGLMHGVRWKNWRVLRSDAIAAKFYTGRGSRPVTIWSDAGDAFLVLAHAVGLSHSAVAAMMKWPPSRTCYRLHLLKKRSLFAGIIKRIQPPIRNRNGMLFAVWQYTTRKFPRLTRIMTAFKDGEDPRTYQDRDCVRGVLATWCKYFARTAEQKRLGNALQIATSSRPASLRRAYIQMSEWGINP